MFESILSIGAVQSLVPGPPCRVQLMPLATPYLKLHQTPLSPSHKLCATITKHQLAPPTSSMPPIPQHILQVGLLEFSYSKCNEWWFFFLICVWYLMPNSNYRLKCMLLLDSFCVFTSGSVRCWNQYRYSILSPMRLHSASVCFFLHLHIKRNIPYLPTYIFTLAYLEINSFQMSILRKNNINWVKALLPIFSNIYSLYKSKYKNIYEYIHICMSFHWMNKTSWWLSK